MHFARTAETPDGHSASTDHWQPLQEHLEGVAERAREFAGRFGCGPWAELAGLWHDLGKYNPDFQQMLLEGARGETKRRVDHSTAGALHARRLLAKHFARFSMPRDRANQMELLLTAPIAGHHAGLSNWVDGLLPRLAEKGALLEAVDREQPPARILEAEYPGHLNRFVDLVSRTICALGAGIRSSSSE